MEPSVEVIKSGFADRFARFVCFFIFSTAGMGAIGITLLAEPLANYYSDKDFILSHQQSIENLEKLRTQREELLKNLDNPSVWQRAAVGNYNHDLTRDDPANSTDQPDQPDQANPTNLTNLTNPPELPIISPDLQKAIDNISQPLGQDQPSRLEEATKILAANTIYQIMLFFLGAALVILSLTCFTRRK